MVTRRTPNPAQPWGQPGLRHHSTPGLIGVATPANPGVLWGRTPKESNPGQPRDWSGLQPHSIPGLGRVGAYQPHRFEVFGQSANPTNPEVAWGCNPNNPGVGRGCNPSQPRGWWGLCRYFLNYFHKKPVQLGNREDVSPLTSVWLSSEGTSINSAILSRVVQVAPVFAKSVHRSRETSCLSSFIKRR